MSIDPKFLLSIFARRLPWFLLVAVTVSVIGIAVAVILPEKYRASALLLFEDAQIPNELAPSTVRTGAAEQLKILEQQLLTRPNLLELANKFSIYSSTPNMNAADIVSDMRNRVEIVSRTGKNDVPTISIAFNGRTANQAFQVANELVNILLQQNVSMRTGRAAQTLDFFQQEVNRLGADLDRQEAVLLAFRTQNQDSLPDSLEFRRSQQSALQERLVQLQREEAAQTDRRRRLVDLYERTGRVDDLTAPQTPEQRQLQAMRAQLDSAQLVYSDQNPRIRALKAQVAALEAAVASKSGASSDSGTGPTIYDTQMAQVDGELAYISDEKKQVTQQIALLQASIAQTPANAARLSELERENSITRGQYAEAVQRLAAAQTGERIEALSRGQRISVVEQPVLPIEPFSPNRKLIALGGVLGGSVLGLGLVVLLELMNRAIRRPSDMVKALTITPLVTLPYVKTDHETRSRRSTLVFVAVGAAVALSLAIYAVHMYYLPLDTLFERILGKIGLG
ncbi:GumC family protein [Phaeovulum sp.]|uniref:GumC family protein n=1 Tax=Phaeovulum sp. TaxID=2934796 RepID=UPI0039E5A9FE